MSVYHVNISVGPRRLTRLDLDEATLVDEVMSPLRDHRPFWFGGLRVDPASVTAVSVSETEASSAELLPKIRRDLSAKRTVSLGIPAEFRVAAEGVDVTERFLAGTASSGVPDDDLLVRVCRNFPRAARALTNRKHGRPDFTIENEYDVQDLLHAYLRLHFEDVRPESWAPEYLGGSSRIDFVLPDEDTIIETKMTRVGLTDRRVGEELAIDLVRYSSHPTARRLVCLVYDPKHLIQNPAGLEADLNARSSDKLIVNVFIVGLGRIWHRPPARGHATSC